MRKFWFGLILLMSIFIFGCSDEVKNVSGTVEASKLEGVKVCLNIAGEDIQCTTTDNNGYFHFNDIVVPADLDLKIGDTLIKKIKVNSGDLEITPYLLAGDNQTLAEYIGALLHSAAGCDMSADSCNLSGIKSLKIDDSDNSLVSQIEKGLQNSSYIGYKTEVDNGSTVKDNVTKLDADIYASFNPTLVGKKAVAYTGFTDNGDVVSIKYYLDNNTLSYELLNSEHSIKLENVYKNLVFKDNNNSLYFLSPNYCFIKDGNSGDVFKLAVGMQYAGESIDTKAICDNKTYYYIDGYDIGRVDVNMDNDTYGEWAFNGFSGNWSLDGNFLSVMQSGDMVGRGFMKPGVNLSGFLFGSLGEDADLALGIEQAEDNITVSDIAGTYYLYSEHFDSDNETACYGNAVISDDDGQANMSITEYCSDMTAIQNYTLDLNPYVSGLGTLKGLVKTQNGVWTLFIDKEDGYFIGISNDGNDIFIGTNKQFK
jgi:hypothetical protein